MIELEPLHTIVNEAIRSVMSDVEGEIGLEEDFKEFGIDSLDSMSVTLEIEKALGIEFAQDFDLTACRNVRRLHEYIGANFQL
jgi:acyl carrier protein